MTLIALKLILAHFIGDFVLQPASWVEDRLQRKARSKYLYFHMGIHAVALLVLLQLDHLWAVALIVGLHFLIDLAKPYLTTPGNHRAMFVLDQGLHLSVLAGVAHRIEPFDLDLGRLLEGEALLLMSFLAFITYVCSIIMRMLLAPYIDEIADEGGEDEGGSLKNAGTYIGMLERLFVFGFILMQQWAAIGLLITAKSVFRFGDLNKGKNRKLTEYVLIGTLLSFGLAFLSGILYRCLSQTLGNPI